MENFDDILTHIGSFGRYQIYVWMLCSPALFIAGIQNLLSVFLIATPEHWCYVPALENLTAKEQVSITALPDVDGDPLCRIQDTDYHAALEDYMNNVTDWENETSSRVCEQWIYDHDLYGSTAVSKWDLVCSKSALPAISQSIYMLGFLLGSGLFGFISDRFGRKVCLLVGMCGITVCGVTSALVPEFWTHSFLRMVVAMCTAGIVIGAFVLYMELIGPEKRMGPGLATSAFFALGYMALAGVACLIRSFVWTNLSMSAVSAIFLVYWWVLPESPRWLISQGRVTEARRILESAAKMNRTIVNLEDLFQEGKCLEKKEVLEEAADRKYTALDLVKTPRLRLRTINMCFNWFVAGMVYYGLSLGVTALAGNPYLNLFFSGLMELASIAAAFFILDRIGRRVSLIMMLVLGGCACIAFGLVPGEYIIIKISLSMIGKFGVAGAFAVNFVFTAELFPTVIRTTAVGTSSVSARIGALIAPFIGQLASVWVPLPTLLFGGLAVSAGILSIHFPETLGKNLPDTMTQGEDFGRDLKTCDLSLPRKRKYRSDSPTNSSRDETDVVVS